jgi:hypothetical protein
MLDSAGFQKCFAFIRGTSSDLHSDSMALRSSIADHDLASREILASVPMGFVVGGESPRFNLPKFLFELLYKYEAKVCLRDVTKQTRER